MAGSCYKVDPAFEKEERQLIEKVSKLFAEEYCPAEPVNIVRDEFVWPVLGRPARQYDNKIGLDPKIVKRAVEMERKREGNGAWPLAWLLSHEIGHVHHGDSEILAGKFGSNILNKIEKRIPGY